MSGYDSIDWRPLTLTLVEYPNGKSEIVFVFLKLDFQQNKNFAICRRFFRQTLSYNKFSTVRYRFWIHCFNIIPTRFTHGLYLPLIFG